MTTSPRISSLLNRLDAFRRSIKPLKKKATAERNGEKFAYAPIEAILAHIAEPLAAQSLYVVQTVTGDIGVTTRVVYDLENDEQWIEDTAIVSIKGPMEDKGAAITQLRRYALVTLLGLPMKESPKPVEDYGLTPAEMRIAVNRYKDEYSTSAINARLYGTVRRDVPQS